MAIFAINIFKTDYLGNIIFLIYFLIVLNFRLFNYLIMDPSKSFGCDVFGKLFEAKNHVTNHIRIHTGEKPFACAICEETFTRKENLTKHIRIHTGVKLYCCDICKKTFTQNSSLAEHTRIHTSQITYSCEVCKKSFLVLHIW